MKTLCLSSLVARWFCISGLVIGVGTLAAVESSAVESVADPQSPAVLTRGMSQALQASGNRVTNEVIRQFAIDCRAAALKQLAAQDVLLPEDFIRQIDTNAETRQAVYLFNGPDAAEMLKHLYALHMDLGNEKFWQYVQLVIAGAVVNTGRQVEADLTPRSSVELHIGGDPRVSVNTKDPSRKLDRDDHIINFLEDRTIEEEVKVGSAKDRLPELKYDANGIAIPQAQSDQGHAKGEVQKRTRSLIAADVIASSRLQQEFNEYMASQGYPQVKIDCGEGVVSWNSRNAVHGTQRKKIAEASKLFQEAYRAKGRLPAEPDPVPTMGQRCAYLIRNYEYQFTEEENKTRKWPRYPLTAAWPTLLYLVDNNQSLREREERWIAFRDQGEMTTYGEYIGGIAQQFDMQSARRLSPYPFTYGTIQMMFKDGGVCGTMANIGARTYCTLGMPACTAGQPGHCALVRYVVDSKTGMYDLVGGQYATGGDEVTTPHEPLFFCFGGPRLPSEKPHDIKQRFPMFVHKSVAWSTNQGMPAFAQSVAAWHIARLLMANEATDQARFVLASGISANPYLYPLVQTQISLLASPERAATFWPFYQEQLAAHAKGGPSNALFVNAIGGELMRRLAQLPSPADRQVAQAGLDFINTLAQPDGTLVARYSIVAQGIDEWTQSLDQQIFAHTDRLVSEASSELDAQAVRIGKMIAETIAQSKDPDGERMRFDAFFAGHELYFDERSRLKVHPAFATLSKLSQRKVVAADYYPAVMERLLGELQSQSEPVYLQNANELSSRIKDLAGRIDDQNAKGHWLGRMLSAAKTHPEVTQTKGKKVLKRPNPCVATVNELMKG